MFDITLALYVYIFSYIEKCSYWISTLYIIKGSLPNIAKVSSFCVVVVLVFGLLNIDDTCGELIGVLIGCEVRFFKVVRSVGSFVVGVVVTRVVVGIVVVTSVGVGIFVVTSVVVGNVVVVFNVVVIIGVVVIIVVISSGKCTIN